jgi:GNAT superfamily N-acetyltransferase
MACFAGRSHGGRMTASRSPNRSPVQRRGRAFRTADGRVLRVRPVRGDDVEALKRGFARLTPEQVRQRTFHRMNELSDEAAHRLADIDLATTAAYVVVDDVGEVRGEARLHVAPPGDSAEFALIVDPQMLGIGIGRALMRRLIEEARRRGLRELWGTVLADNALMLDFSHRLGAVRERVPDEAGVVRVRFDLARRRRSLPAPRS